MTEQKEKADRQSMMFSIITDGDGHKSSPAEVVCKTTILPYNHFTILPCGHIIGDTCTMPVTPYGNAEPGDYPALFTGCFEAQFPKAKRLIFGFAILNPDPS